MTHYIWPHFLLVMSLMHLFIQINSGVINAADFTAVLLHKIKQALINYKTEPYITVYALRTYHSLTSFPCGNKSQTIRQYSMAASTLHVQRDFEIGARGMNAGPRDFVKSNSMRQSHDMPKYGV